MAFERKADEYQRHFESFLLGATRESYFTYRDDEFVLRYGSGGVLPVLRLHDQPYYCLFYRDIDPVGWNIANGGMDSPQELFDPRLTAEREFCEELSIVDLSSNRIYRFDCEMLNDPWGLRARAFWRSSFQSRHNILLEDHELKVKWIDGVDSVHITSDNKQSLVRGCFVNINALDFGIEIDWVAEISLHDEIVVCDGEILEPSGVNRPVGLFSVPQLQQQVLAGVSRFQPDLLFHDGMRRDPHCLDTVVSGEFMSTQARLRTANQRLFYNEICRQDRQYDLCPVTRNIVHRHNFLS